MIHSDSYREFLQAELDRRMQINPRYSQRAFAKQLGMSPGEMSEVLKGKRALSLRSAIRVAQGLGLNEVETKRLLFLIQQEKAGGSLPEKTRKATVDTLSLDVFAVISDWYHFGILSLAECEHFRWSADWIARRLGIKEEDVHRALLRLLRVGLIEKKAGRLQLKDGNFSSPDGISSEAIRNYHRQILSKAIQALETQPVEEREISGISIALPRHSIADFKKDVSRFLDEMGNKYTTRGKKQEVYHLETALFRLTNEESK